VLISTGLGDGRQLAAGSYPIPVTGFGSRACESRWLARAVSLILGWRLEWGRSVLALAVRKPIRVRQR